MRILYTIIFATLLSTVGFGQNDRLYTMFVFNKLQYNPAYAGSAEALVVGAHYRHQWQGIEGAPRTMSAFAHTPLLKGRSGLGFSLISDDIGILNTTFTVGSYSYRIGFGNNTTLSLGLSAEFDFTRFDWSKADLTDSFDDIIPFGEPSGSVFNAGFGAYYSGSKFYVGASIPRFLRNTLTSETYRKQGNLNHLRTHYFMGGGVIDINPKIKLKPSILVTYIKNVPLEMDFNLSVLFLDQFWVGLSYRLEESVDFFVQVPINKQLKVAIGADYTVSELNTFTTGSLEVMLEYVFKYDNEKINNIRFF